MKAITHYRVARLWCKMASTCTKKNVDRPDEPVMHRCWQNGWSKLKKIIQAISQMYLICARWPTVEKSARISLRTYPCSLPESANVCIKFKIMTIKMGMCRLATQARLKTAGLAQQHPAGVSPDWGLHMINSKHTFFPPISFNPPYSSSSVKLITTPSISEPQGFRVPTCLRPKIRI